MIFFYKNITLDKSGITNLKQLQTRGSVNMNNWVSNKNTSNISSFVVIHGETIHKCRVPLYQECPINIEMQKKMKTSTWGRFNQNLCTKQKNASACLAKKIRCSVLPAIETCNFRLKFVYHFPKEDSLSVQTQKFGTNVDEICPCIMPSVSLLY